MFDDLRSFIKAAEERGECRVLEGADWNLEMGTLADALLADPNSPIIVFDAIKDYPRGYRVTTNLFSTSRRRALAIGLPAEAKGLELVQAWRQKTRGGFKPVKPVEVKTGPVMENVHRGDAVNLWKFPVPKWHELDGGRYIGTGTMTITRDPDEGWVNLGTYRVQVHDETTATIYMSPGRHADIMRRKYWSKGQACPAVVTCGQEPLLWAMSQSLSVPLRVSEYDYSGWLKGEPIKVVKGVVTDLPIPATAEIALEGEILPPEVETRIEGPFGEWPRHYGSGARPEPAFKVKAVLHRNDPIIQGNPPFWLSSESLGLSITQAAAVWDELDRQLPGIAGVGVIEQAPAHTMVVIAIDQKYAGHAKQAAMIAAGSRTIGYMCRFVILVDSDIDPTNLQEVLVSLGSRCEPEESIEIIRGCWGSPLDPRLSPERRQRGDFSHSMAIIDTCKPFYWRKEFPPTIKTDPELTKKTLEKWAKYLR